MEEPISSSIFPEKDNKIEISSKNINIAPRFEDIVDIKNYSIKNIKELTSNRYQIKHKSEKLKLRFCFKKIGHTLCL